MSVFLLYAHIALHSCVSHTGHNDTRFRNVIRCAKGSSVHVSLYFLSYEASVDRFALVVSNLKAAYVHMETLSRRKNYEHYDIHL